MLNRLNQSRLWMAASLIIAASTFAQSDNNKCRPKKSFEQGHEMSQSQVMAGYNSPACIQINDSWNMYGNISYLYWQAREENLEIGIVSRNNAEGNVGTSAADEPFTTSYVNEMRVTSPNFTYRPGFKIGLGATLGRDGWDVLAEYTWFHGSIGSGVRPLTGNISGSTVLNGEYLYAIQGDEGTNFYQDADQSWNLKLDFLDIVMGRSYYSGTKLTVHPFFGARGAWIRQTVNTTFVGSTNYTDNLGYHKNNLHSAYSSWGVGPRAGFDSNWLLGYGVRFIGNGAMDVLYTRYEIQQNEQEFTLETVVSPISKNVSISQTVDYLRTHADLEIGFGWGSYFDNDNWHIDLAATYGFQIFWDQNMFRNNSDSANAPGKSFVPNGNLYVHGVTVNAKLDF